MSKINKRR